MYTACVYCDVEIVHLQYMDAENKLLEIKLTTNAVTKHPERKYLTISR